MTHERSGPEGFRSRSSTALRRLFQRRRDGDTSAAEPGPGSDPLGSRVAALEVQLNYVESVLEGLQDAVHRRSILEDGRNEEMMKRLEPANLARELTDDARGRGL